MVLAAFGLIAIGSLLTTRSHAQEQRALYLDDQDQTPRVEDLLSRMTQDRSFHLFMAQIYDRCDFQIEFCTKTLVVR